jgi:hypothetical protein
MTSPLSESDIRALADQAEATVVTDGPQLDYDLTPQDRQQRPYEWARDVVGVAQDQARAKLIELRAKRDDINAEIKLLVDEVELLDRMWAIAKKKEAKDG